MPTYHAFAYNPSKITIPNATNYGDLAVGTMYYDWSQDPGGLKWWAGPYEDAGIVIARSVPAGNQPTPIGGLTFASVGFDYCNNDPASFVSKINELAGTSHTLDGEAVAEASSQGWWTNYELVPILPFEDMQNRTHDYRTETLISNMSWYPWIELDADISTYRGLTLSIFVDSAQTVIASEGSYVKQNPDMIGMGSDVYFQFSEAREDCEARVIIKYIDTNGNLVDTIGLLLRPG